MAVSHVFPHEISTFIDILVHNLCIYTIQLKKIYNYTHIWIQIVLSLSLLFFFLLISFGYTHEFTPFFIGFLKIYLY